MSKPEHKEYIRCGYAQYLFRPESWRRVSGVKECNRLLARIEQLEAELDILREDDPLIEGLQRKYEALEKRYEKQLKLSKFKVTQLEEAERKSDVAFRALAVITAQKRIAEGHAYTAEDLFLARDECGVLDELRELLEKNPL